MPPALTRDQVRNVDRRAIDRYHMSGLVLMENAGRNAAALIDDRLGPDAQVWICCGSGNNGGDGCVIARHLSNRGWSVRLMITGNENRMTPDTLANYRIIRAMGIDITVAADAATQNAEIDRVTEADVVIDALLGTGFRGAVRSPTDALIDRINAATKRAIVAIDLPSGLDCDTGEPSNATVCADLTITFVARKIGFDAPQAAAYLGRVEVADIGAPVALLDEVRRNVE